MPGLISACHSSLLNAGLVPKSSGEMVRKDNQLIISAPLIQDILIHTQAQNGTDAMVTNPTTSTANGSLAKTCP